ncbi:shikimate dehydrogenase [Microbacterium murale]|uniref:Shikimate dehydrogenase (NADP(+)) n=1 Tax=Microbacterium murale TaxID=1081040 RepID=A0ABQ1RJU4_9MICO|nr:shikimate dehydrogenase [Microbacterium murale]GGD70285.1 shikimate dehydrogenase (NADP(+)) [Microbacterium murale]
MTIGTPLARRRAVLIGLIGEGVTPSLSPPMHESEGARHGMNYVYRTIDLAPDEGTTASLRTLLAAARRLGFNGLNITHPVKQAIIPLLDELSDSARAVGAVNTVVFTDAGTMGHNTDVTGFAAALKDAFGDEELRRVVLFGTGGAGSAVATALAQHPIGELVLIDQVRERAAGLADQVRALTTATVRAGAVDDLPALIADTHLIINATPVGMAAHPGTPFDTALLPDGIRVADIVYRPADTALLQAARARGIRTMSGLGMAMHQAADAFEIFTGERADRTAMLADLDHLVAAEAAAPAGPATPDATPETAPERGENR